MTFCWTAWQPYRLSYILGLYMSFFYLPKDHFLKFWWKIVQNWWIWKMDFFWKIKIPIFKIQKSLSFLASFLFKCPLDSWLSWIWFNFYDNSDFQQKIRGGGGNNMRHPVLWNVIFFFERPYLSMNLILCKGGYIICFWDVLNLLTCT